MILFVVSTVSLVLVSVTMLARANDQRFRPGWQWRMRLVGFMLAGSAPIGIIGYEVMFLDGPTIYETVFRVGLAFVFLTTPGQPPWHKWITRGVDSCY